MLHGMGVKILFLRYPLPLVIEAFGTALMFSIAISLAEF